MPGHIARHIPRHMPRHIVEGVGIGESEFSYGGAAEGFEMGAAG